MDQLSKRREFKAEMCNLHIGISDLNRELKPVLCSEVVRSQPSPGNLKSRRLLNILLWEPVFSITVGDILHRTQYHRSMLLNDYASRNFRLIEKFSKYGGRPRYTLRLFFTSSGNVVLGFFYSLLPGKTEISGELGHRRMNKDGNYLTLQPDWSLYRLSWWRELNFFSLSLCSILISAYQSWQMLSNTHKNLPTLLCPLGTCPLRLSFRRRSSIFPEKPEVSWRFPIETVSRKNGSRATIFQHVANKSRNWTQPKLSGDIKLFERS